ncbi:hypothetical protein J5690_02385 [bacterium]|nr:hypothetical protein [bacterium]
MFAKMIGICATVFMLSQVAGIGGEQIKYFTDIVKITLTQHEVNSIAHLVYTGQVIGRNRLPEREPEEWSKYIRREMKADIPGRDSSKDYWDKSYEILEVENVPGLSGEGFIVRSCGPDTSAGTEDDITAGYEYLK